MKMRAIPICLLLTSQALLARLPENLPQANTRPVEGSRQEAAIDTETPLPKLVSRLEGEWQLVSTGKMYLIGYTNDMYSIAAHGEKALSELNKLIKNTKSAKAKSGAILCIHLIGIESTVSGRFAEDFNNEMARQTLLALADDNEFGPMAINLLARDPWKSDLPTLVRILKKHEKPNPALIHALFRYVREGFPFREDIDEKLDQIPVYFETSEGKKRLGVLTTVLREKPDDDPKIINKMKRPDYVIQWDDTLTNRIVRRYTPAPDSPILSEIKFGKIENVLSQFLRLSREKVGVFSYCGQLEPYCHYVEQGAIIIVDDSVARKRWISHFDKHPPAPQP
ncbi:hypothetical protein SAMN02745181_0280 [Rubritalea squalenifaciens DSM 18772]|uniref:HEAT repeat domain-containing protein n=2 Tax=Rubritalea squalenifaciens TaxID=407226 RepID=A0A1M6BQ03_9BACT|nr:hypothetical protein SAMN02745181_0280 [Rubritalea squalenifaciens DSM 18772]